MKLIERNGLRILTSDFGYLLHDKTMDSYTSKVYLGKNASLDNFEEVEDTEINRKLVEKIVEIQDENKVRDELIDISMLAMDEIFMTFEPLLEVIQVNLTNERIVSKMANMYVAMIQRKIKTINEVPLRYREEVKQILEQLEK